ncbi:YheU family protein [Pelagibaculum spongiae]|uniref:YheU family protein n=1 Tax=Pelagibaculum spongiae TaxID=2080658 RepID=A0A2V1GVP5_9GAMM|nr:YheU family protein [Pelagibaculum spongiae]PVZ70465.1 hypothetical protein DC094_07735 [Pelagibaculum spongiae]
MIQIPLSQIPKENLSRMLEEFVTRNGTDYGMQEWSLMQKVQQIEHQLQTGLAGIVFDQESGEVDIWPAERIPAEWKLAD